MAKNYEVRKKGGNTEVAITAHGGRSLLGGRSLRTAFRKKKVPAGLSVVFYGPDRAVLRSGSLKYEFIDHNLAGSAHKTKGPGDGYIDYGLIHFEEETEKSISAALTKFDVVVIKPNTEVKLSEILSDLAGSTYRKVHCSFCRSYDSLIGEVLAGRKTFTTPT